MASDSDTQTAQGQKPRSGLVWVIVAVVNALLIGGGAFFVLRRAPSGEGAEASHGAPSVSAAAGSMLKLEPFIANLNEPDGNRYLKVTLSVEMADEPALQAADVHLTRFRDAVLVFLSSLGVADTQGAEGKEEIRKRILARARNLLGQEAVRGVFYSEFVLQ